MTSNYWRPYVYTMDIYCCKFLKLSNQTMLYKSCFYVSQHMKFWSLSHVYELRHVISNNVVCATSKCSDQPAHTGRLIRAFASRLNILWVLSYWTNIFWSFQVWKEAAQALLSLHLSKCHIVGNHMLRLNYMLSMPMLTYPASSVVRVINLHPHFVYVSCQWILWRDWWNVLAFQSLHCSPLRLQLEYQNSHVLALIP